MSEDKISYRLLSDSDFDALYRAFLVAFSDYQVNMNVSPERFRERLVRDGVELQLSAGAFRGHEIAGFYINGLGNWKGRLTAYDAGTAVAPNYRGRGIGKQLFEFLLPHLRTTEVKQYLLEVITTNTPAVNLYRKLGFKDTRKFAVYRANQQHLRPSPEGGIKLRDVHDPYWQLYQSFWDGEPSWQNSIEAIKRVQTAIQIVGAFLQDDCIGYGILHFSTGNLMQLAVAPAHRRKHVASAIVGALQSRLNPGELLKITNVDAQMKSAIAFYDAIGFSEILSQFEMMRVV